MECNGCGGTLMETCYRCNGSGINKHYKKEDLQAFYKLCRELEQENKDVLVGFQEDYPGVLNGDNLAEILKAAKAKKQK